MAELLASWQGLTLDDVDSFAEDFRAKYLNNGSVIVLFYAEMGAGKTTLIRSLAKSLGVDSNITSPTFVGLNHYALSDKDIYHYDLYQVAVALEDALEFLDQEKQKIFFMEWAENLEPSHLELFEKKAKLIKLSIEVSGESERNLQLKI